MYQYSHFSNSAFRVLDVRLELLVFSFCFGVILCRALLRQQAHKAYMPLSFFFFRQGPWQRNRWQGRDVSQTGCQSREPLFFWDKTPRRLEQEAKGRRTSCQHVRPEWFQAIGTGVPSSKLSTFVGMGSLLSFWHQVFTLLLSRPHCTSQQTPMCALAFA